MTHNLEFGDYEEGKPYPSRTLLEFVKIVKRSGNDDKIKILSILCELFHDLNDDIMSFTRILYDCIQFDKKTKLYSIPPNVNTKSLSHYHKYPEKLKQYILDKLNE